MRIELSGTQDSAWHQVVSRSRESKDPAHLEYAAMPDLSHKRNGLQPSEAFFNPFALELADPIAGVPGRWRINGAAASSVFILRHMRGNSQIPALGYEILGVVSFVGCHGHSPRA